MGEALLEDVLVWDISWMSRKRELIVLSSDEVEYIVACEVRKGVVWLRNLMSELFEGRMDPIVIHCDNTSSIRLSEDPVFHGNTKHINNKYHYILKLVQDGVFQLQHISIDEHVVDILTKYKLIIIFYI